MKINNVNDLLLILKDKYDYCDELLSFLNKIVPAFLYIYGEDRKSHIFNALCDCEIHIQKKGEEPGMYYNNYFGLNEKFDFPSFTGAALFDELFFDNGEICKKEMIYLRTFYTKNYEFDFSNVSNLAGITHEICHLVKSYNNFIVDGDLVYSYSGLIKNSFKYDNDLRKFVKVDKTYNVGFEEALNSCDEEDIMKMVFDKSYNAVGYKHECESARRFIDDDNFKSLIRNTQFNYSDNWKNFLGVEQSNSLIESFDTLVNMHYLHGYDYVKRKDELKKQRSDAFMCLQGILDNMDNKNLKV